MLDISNTVHEWSFSALTVFTWAENPNKPTLGPTTRSGIHQQWSYLWWSGFRCCLCAHLTFGDQLREWRHVRVDHCLRLKHRTSMTKRALVSLLTVFIEVWHVLILFLVADWHIRDSGGLVINHNPQFFMTFIVKAARVTFHGRVWCYIIIGELVYIA